MEPIRWHWTRFSGLDAPALYRIVALREAVFVVEQDCAYLDCDGLDLQAWHLLGWRGATLLAYLRVLPPDLVYPDKRAIGRVVVAPAARRGGLGAELMREGLRHAEALGPEPIKISAQAYLEDWYRRLGFETCGDGYLEDGIPHLPMIKTRTTPR